MAIRNFNRPISLDTALSSSNTNDMSQANDTSKDAPAQQKESKVRNESGHGLTYAFQDQLPELPIPDLESSCASYLRALHPIQSPKEHADTKAAVKEFLRSEGPDLQEKLQKYAGAKSNYIEQFCMIYSVTCKSCARTDIMKGTTPI
jgi:carnitine O-acetyltransferase